MLEAKRRPMAATTPCITVSTGIRETPRQRQVAPDLQVDGHVGPGAVGSQEVLPLDAGALVGMLGVVLEA